MEGERERVAVATEPVCQSAGVGGAYEQPVESDTEPYKFGDMSYPMQRASVQRHLDLLFAEGAATPMDANHHPGLPDWYDWTLFKRGQQYFHTNIFSMFVAKMSGLVTILTVPSILNVLMVTNQSSEPQTAFHRYVQTVLVMMSWYDGDLVEPTSRAHKTLMGVRSRHCAAARRARKAGKGTITQLDLALTQFGFVGFAVAVPDKLGLSTETRDVEGFIHFWRVIGHLLGIQDKFNLCRGSVLETQMLCRQLIQQVFAPSLRTPSEDFLCMSRALVDGMWNVMPFLDYKAFLGFISHLAGIDTKQSCKSRTISEAYSHLLLTQQMFVHEVLLQRPLLSWVARTYLNYQMRLTLFLTERCPFLAYWTFGRENIRLPFLQHS